MRKFVVILSLKIPPHLMCVATLPCEMSQRFIDRTIGQWGCRPERVVQQQGEHIEHTGYDVNTAGCDSYFRQ